MKKYIKVFSLILAVAILSSGTLFARSKNVKRTGSEKMVYQESGVYQEAFYDYGTANWFDDARITAKSVGSKTNYASIRFADYYGGSFQSRKRTTAGNVMAIVDYISGQDYLKPGSYAYSTGTTVLDLNVVE